MRMNTQAIEYRDGDTELTGQFVWDAGRDDKRPGILVVVYGGAMHGFTHETPRAVPGIAYHALSDARSATAMRSFFAELFG